MRDANRSPVTSSSSSSLIASAAESLWSTPLPLLLLPFVFLASSADSAGDERDATLCDDGILPLVMATPPTGTDDDMDGNGDGDGESVDGDDMTTWAEEMATGAAVVTGVPLLLFCDALPLLLMDAFLFASVVGVPGGDSMVKSGPFCDIIDDEDDVTSERDDGTITCDGMGGVDDEIDVETTTCAWDDNGGVDDE